MARELGPNGEYSRVRNITFDGPSLAAINHLDEKVRLGLEGTVTLGKATIPPPHVFRQVSVRFSSDKYENSPYGRDDIPRHVSCLEFNVEVVLRKGTHFSEGTALKILEALQANTGKGFYRQLPRGTHEIVVPGEEQVVIGRHDFPQSFLHDPVMGSTTVLNLGVDDPQRGYVYLSALRKVIGDPPAPHQAWDAKYIEEKINLLKDERIKKVNTLTISMMSNYLHDSGIPKGESRELKGALDRRFGLDRNKQDYAIGSSYLGVSVGHVLPFFENSAFLLQAICDGLEVGSSQKISIPVMHPGFNEPNPNAKQEIPQVFRDYLSSMGFE